MKAVISGRMFEGNVLVGYRVWILHGENIQYYTIPKSRIKELFSRYDVINCKYNARNNSVKSLLNIGISEYPKYNKFEKLASKNKYTDASIIAMSLKIPVDNIRIVVCGSLVYGAISDPEGVKAQKHAEMYYEEIRKMTTDVHRIARNTGYKESDILKVKNYLFMDMHDLDTGYKRFDPSFHIAQSWQRLMSKNADCIEKHDITLIQHELLEINLVANGTPQSVAHEYAQGTYNYGKESKEYYDKIKRHQNER